MPQQPATIFKMLDISTGHVSKKTAEWIQDSIDGSVLRTARCPIMYDKSDYGWIIRVSEDFKDFDLADAQDFFPGTPDDLLNVLLHAARLDCDWVMFDGDGQVYDGLPTFDW